MLTFSIWISTWKSSPNNGLDDKDREQDTEGSVVAGETERDHVVQLMESSAACGDRERDHGFSPRPVRGADEITFFN